MAFSNRKYLHFWLLLVAMYFLGGCAVKRVIPKDRLLLSRNTVVVKNESRFRHLTEAESQLLLKPNKRVFSNAVPVYLWKYVFRTPKDSIVTGGNLSNRQIKKNKKIRDKFLKREEKLRTQKIEAPVLLDTIFVNLSATNIKNYFYNNGYLLAKVSTRIDTISTTRANVTYIVDAGPLHYLNSFFVSDEDTQLKKDIWQVVDSIKRNKLSETFSEWKNQGNSFEELKLARNMIATALQEKGYFLFSPSQIYFNVNLVQEENSDKPNQIRVELFYNDKVSKLTYKHFRTGNVQLTVYSADSTGTKSSEKVGEITVKSNYNKINNKFLAELITLRKGEIITPEKLKRTIQNLNELNIFDNSELKYNIDTVHYLLDVEINVSMLKRSYFSLEPQGLYSPKGTANLNGFSSSTTSRSFGLAAVMSYTNRNFAKHAQRLTISSITSYEAVFKKLNTSNLGTAFQQGVNFSYSVPHYQGIGAIDRFMERKLGYTGRNTIFNFNFQSEKNINFNRLIFPASWNIKFTKKTGNLIITPVEFSYARNVADPDYLAQLTSVDYLYVLSVFRNSITSPFRIQYNTIKDLPQFNSNIQFNSAIETSGNVYRAIKRWTDKNFLPTNSYTLFNQQYFQYVKLDGQFIFKNRIDALNSLALRIKSGVALPYANSKVVPYDKRYFIGGSNSLRAWRPRQMGPGDKLEDPKTLIDRSGELLIEGNFEYKYNVVQKFLEMAAFFDIGNIFNLGPKRQPAGTPGVINDLSEISDLLAMDAGIGARFDFTFFIFRLDWAWAIYDPGKVQSERWVLKSFPGFKPGFSKYIGKETALAFGIGYPF